MNAKLFGAAFVLSAALALSGCGSGGGSGSGGYGAPSTTAPSTSTPATSASASAVAGVSGLKVADTSLGKIVVSSTGMTVYQYAKDVKDSATSACTGGCLAAWPPVTTTTDTPTLEGVTGQVGTITTPEGAKQVTLNGLPLYYWAQDQAPGEVTGQGIQNVWYVVAPNGDMIK